AVAKLTTIRVLWITTIHARTRCTRRRPSRVVVWSATASAMSPSVRSSNRPKDTSWRSLVLKVETTPVPNITNIHHRSRRSMESGGPSRRAAITTRSANRSAVTSRIGEGRKPERPGGVKGGEVGGVGHADAVGEQQGDEEEALQGSGPPQQTRNERERQRRPQPVHGEARFLTEEVDYAEPDAEADAEARQKAALPRS